MEYYKENWINWECRYGLKTIESCRACLFSVLCHLEKTNSLVNKRKEKSDLYSNNNKEWV